MLFYVFFKFRNSEIFLWEKEQKMMYWIYFWRNWLSSLCFFSYQTLFLLISVSSFVNWLQEEARSICESWKLKFASSFRAYHKWYIVTLNSLSHHAFGALAFCDPQALAPVSSSHHGGYITSIQLGEVGIRAARGSRFAFIHIRLEHSRDRRWVDTLETEPTISASRSETVRTFYDYF